MNSEHIEIAGNSEKRQEIVSRAYGVFYRHGFHASGVDSLLADSGISKRTMYKYFRSKEDLITATVQHYAALTQAQAEAVIAACPGSSKDKILALFDWRRDILAAGDYSGCFATNAKLEYEGKNETIETTCTAFLEGIENGLAALCAAEGIADNKAAARQLMILMEGTIVYGQTRRSPAVAQAARAAASVIIDHFKGLDFGKNITI